MGKVEKQRLINDETPDGSQPRKKAFTLFGKLSLNFKVGIFLFCLFSIIGGSGQSVGLPLFLSTLPANPAYFVLWIASLFFTLVFGAGALFLIYQGAVTKEMRAWKWHKYMFLVGFFDAMNGILVVFSAPLSRVPGPVGAILANITIVFTIIASKFLLKKVYTVQQFLGAVLVFAGIAVSLIPTFQSMTESGSGRQGAWWWPLVALAGYLPGALMNVVQEKMQDKYRLEAYGDRRFSVVSVAPVESSYQWLCICFLFWADLLPGFGFMTNVSSFWDTMTTNWKCFWGIGGGHCNHSGQLGLLFMMSYLTTYVFGTEMTLYASANLGAVVGTIPPLIAVKIFWFSFPSVNSWAGGAPLTKVDLACALGAFPLLVSGIILYRRFEKEDKEPQKDELESGPVELCW